LPEDIQSKSDLHHLALVSCQFSTYAIPLLYRHLRLSLSGGLSKGKQLLRPEAYKNLIYTKDLFIDLSKPDHILLNSDECSRIYKVLDTIRSIHRNIYNFQRLHLIIDIFSMTDCAHDGVMYPMECCNQVIYALIRDIMHRTESMKTFKLTMIRKSNDDVQDHDRHVEQIISSLATQISDLKVSVTPALVGKLIPKMSKLESLEVLAKEDDSFGIDGEFEDDMYLVNGNLWPGEISSSSLNLVEQPVDFGKKFLRYLPSNLTTLLLDRCPDIIATCVVCFNSLPRLVVCSLVDGQVKDLPRVRSTIITTTSCRDLKVIRFSKSFVPLGLLSVIAEKNPRLEDCSAPIGASDSDIISLSNHCKNLRSLEVSYATSNQALSKGLGSDYKVSIVGLESILGLKNLKTLRLHPSQFSVMDRRFLERLIWGDKLVETIKIRESTRPDHRREYSRFMICKDIVKLSLEPFKKYIQRNHLEGNDIQIQIEELRKERGGKFIRNFDI
jgi:hypothetical protein